MLFRKLEKSVYGNSILMVTLSSYFSYEENKNTTLKSYVGLAMCHTL